ncbi:hypothetical protein ANCCAN_22809 [Ancylostoma caninum]|uniref:Maelstrom domain-containing protein n=1 Tax=Ancylostoma caninum TaxID=29170 RepID=A0A368FK86_ANCCA|nr:hypothetical protein ANCCAN_22809 [Ancylostoma caninum]
MSSAIQTQTPRLYAYPKFGIQGVNLSLNSRASRPRRRRRAEQRSEDFRRISFITDDEIEEDEFFPISQPAITSGDGDGGLDQFFAAKMESDRAMVREAIMNQTDGCVEKIKELRFLLAAVQTFGNVDGMCLMAEYAMNEFNLRDGVVDRFTTMVGPWQISNDIQRSRAEFHSNETHRIPLNIVSTQLDKRQVYNFCGCLPK